MLSRQIKPSAVIQTVNDQAKINVISWLLLSLESTKMFNMSSKLVFISKVYKDIRKNIKFNQVFAPCCK